MASLYASNSPWRRVPTRGPGSLLLIAPGLRDALGRAWVLPFVGAAGILVATTLDVDPIHDIGLFVFEGAWVALGVALLRRPAMPRMV